MCVFKKKKKKMFSFYLYQTMAGLKTPYFKTSRPHAAKSDLEQENIFSPRTSFCFRRPGHMLWNEAGQQTKQVVTCPCADPIDLLSLAPAILGGTASPEKYSNLWQEKTLESAFHEATIPKYFLIYSSKHDNTLKKKRLLGVLNVTV